MNVQEEFNETTKEAFLLAEQQLEVLERRFPNYEHSMHGAFGCCWIRVDGHPGLGVILVADFLCDHVKIGTASHQDDSSWSDRFTFLLPIVVHYADPGFTKNTLSDILEEVG